MNIIEKCISLFRNKSTRVQKQRHKVKEGELNFIVNLNDDKWKFLHHAMIEGKLLIPIALYLNITWDVFKGFYTSSKFSVTYKNVKIHKQNVEIPSNGNVELVAMVQKGRKFIYFTRRTTCRNACS